MKNKGGRPRKLTREIKDALIDGVSRGLTLKAACKCAGISYSSLANWKKLARGGDQDADVYTDFIANINVAMRYAQYQQRQLALALIKKEDFKFFMGLETLKIIECNDMDSSSLLNGY